MLTVDLIIRVIACYVCLQIRLDCLQQCLPVGGSTELYFFNAMNGWFLLIKPYQTRHFKSMISSYSDQ